MGMREVECARWSMTCVEMPMGLGAIASRGGLPHNLPTIRLKTDNLAKLAPSETAGADGMPTPQFPCRDAISEMQSLTLG